MNLQLNLGEISLRLLLAFIVSGAIGYEREIHNRPAGVRTHILVGMGAAIIALIQEEIGLSAVQLVTANPKLVGVVSFDEARLIAQVVSGVGFLGAGTIIVHKRTVTGLTTAASIWAVAALGLASGMGYYLIALPGTVSVIIALVAVKRILRFPSDHRLELQFTQRQETLELLKTYFTKKSITILEMDFSTDQAEEKYMCIYSLELPKKVTYAELVEELACYPMILSIRLLTD